MKPFSNLLLSVGMLLTVTACATLFSQPTAPSPVPTSSRDGDFVLDRNPAVPQTIAPSPGLAGTPKREVFEGITPCSHLTRPLPQIPADTNCEQMIWKLILYRDPATGTPATYALNSAYGVPQQGTLGLQGGGTVIAMEGKWAIAKGIKTDPDAVVYQLNPDNPQTAFSFLKITVDILHVLASDRTLLGGNGGWSYNLNRTDNRIPPPINGQRGSVSEPPPRPPIPPMPPDSSISGVFEGRTPCHDIVLEFTQVTPYSGCVKIKWRLTLYQNRTTGAPSTYLYMGTSTIREGTWTIARGTDSDPNAIIYQLHLDGSQKPVSFLKADENHLFLLDRDLNFLVGDALFSYTLSRTDKDAQ
ncbi:hypothetical protein TFLX_01104 [Thermoflexales bacterium]|nr:hypothetical protein TFLX_01104 [Thermoflexales bacterium]